MARFKHYDYQQTKMIPLRFSDQIQPGTFEYTLNHVVDNELDLSVFESRHLAKDCFIRLLARNYLQS